MEPSNVDFRQLTPLPANSVSAARKKAVSRVTSGVTLSGPGQQQSFNTSGGATVVVSPPTSKVQQQSGGVVTTVVQVAPPTTQQQQQQPQHVVVSSASGSTTTTTIEMPADTLQLMGMASSLPTSNLFVNYPHTMWEKDADGNRIPVQVIKQEGGTAVAVAQNAAQLAQVGGASGGDLLSQAAATIKTEQGSVASTSTAATVVTAGTSGTQGSTMVLQRAQPPPKNPDQPRPHICDICQKGFVKREHLTKHLRIHKSDNKRYSCEYCQKAFRDRYELVRHTRRHTGDFPFRCQECDKGFMRHERYMTHLRWHSGERPFECNMCEKSFRDRSELNRHSRRHTGDLPYKCETCGKGFLRRERYVTHVRIHTGEKPFVCAVCSRGYRDKRELKKHQVAHNHSGQSAPIPGTQPALPNAAAGAAPAAAPTVLHTSTGTTNAISINNSHATPAVAIAAPSSAPVAPVISQVGGEKTIIIQQTVSLPNQPVPKELLNGPPTQVIQQPQPLNPATIPLPPSVASALQSINEKVAAKQAKAKQQQLQAMAQPTTIAVKQEMPTQVITLPPNALQASSGNSNGGPPYYYVMPGNVPYNIASEGGTTVRLTTGEGNMATAQLVSVPAGAIQVVQQATNGTAIGNSNWILEGGSAVATSVAPTTNASNRSAANATANNGVQPPNIQRSSVSIVGMTNSNNNKLKAVYRKETNAAQHSKADEETVARELLQLKTQSRSANLDYGTLNGRGYILSTAQPGGNPAAAVATISLNSQQQQDIQIPNLDGNMTDEGSDSDDEKEQQPSSGLLDTAAKSTAAAAAVLPSTSKPPPKPSSAPTSHSIKSLLGVVDDDDDETGSKESKPAVVKSFVGEQPAEPISLVVRPASEDGAVDLSTSSRSATLPSVREDASEVLNLSTKKEDKSKPSSSESTTDLKESSKEALVVEKEVLDGAASSKKSEKEPENAMPSPSLNLLNVCDKPNVTPSKSTSQIQPSESTPSERDPQKTAPPSLSIDAASESPSGSSSTKNVTAPATQHHPSEQNIAEDIDENTNQTSESHQTSPTSLKEQEKKEERETSSSGITKTTDSESEVSTASVSTEASAISEDKDKAEASAALEAKGSSAASTSVEVSAPADEGTTLNVESASKTGESPNNIIAPGVSETAKAEADLMTPPKSSDTPVVKDPAEVNAPVNDADSLDTAEDKVVPNISAASPEVSVNLDSKVPSETKSVSEVSTKLEAREKPVITQEAGATSKVSTKPEATLSVDTKPEASASSKVSTKPESSPPDVSKESSESETLAATASKLEDVLEVNKSEATSVCLNAESTEASKVSSKPEEPVHVIQEASAAPKISTKPEETSVDMKPEAGAAPKVSSKPEKASVDMVSNASAAPKVSSKPEKASVDMIPEDSAAPMVDTKPEETSIDMKPEVSTAPTVSSKLEKASVDMVSEVSAAPKVSSKPEETSVDMIPEDSTKPEETSVDMVPEDSSAPKVSSKPEETSVDMESEATEASNVCTKPKTTPSVDAKPEVSAVPEVSKKPEPSPANVTEESFEAETAVGSKVLEVSKEPEFSVKTDTSSKPGETKAAEEVRESPPPLDRKISESDKGESGESEAKAEDLKDVAIDRALVESKDSHSSLDQSSSESPSPSVIESQKATTKLEIPKVGETEDSSKNEKDSVSTNVLRVESDVKDSSPVQSEKSERVSETQVAAGEDLVAKDKASVSESDENREIKATPPGSKPSSVQVAEATPKSETESTQSTKGGEEKPNAEITVDQVAKSTPELVSEKAMVDSKACEKFLPASKDQNVEDRKKVEEVETAVIPTKATEEPDVTAKIYLVSKEASVDQGQEDGLDKSDTGKTQAEGVSEGLSTDKSATPESEIRTNSVVAASELVEPESSPIVENIDKARSASPVPKHTGADLDEKARETAPIVVPEGKTAETAAMNQISEEKSEKQATPVLVEGLQQSPKDSKNESADKPETTDGKEQESSVPTEGGVISKGGEDATAEPSASIVKEQLDSIETEMEKTEEADAVTSNAKPLEVDVKDLDCDEAGPLAIEEEEELECSRENDEAEEDEEEESHEDLLSLETASTPAVSSSVARTFEKLMPVSTSSLSMSSSSSPAPDSISLKSSASLDLMTPGLSDAPHGGMTNTRPSSSSSSLDLEQDLDGDKGTICNVCSKEFATESEMIRHKKKHKVDSPLVCKYCSRQYVDKNRYDIHIRFHTGETPFKCHICGKGFRDERKMKLHIRRHTGSLGHKCHLCPRSFEGQKSLNKHLLAHKNNRCVTAKVFTKADGTVALALPEDPNQKKARSGESAEMVAPSGVDVVAEAAAVLPSPTTVQVLPDETKTAASPSPAATAALTVLQQPEEQGTISLSVDDLMQYATPLPDSVVQESHHPPSAHDLADTLTEPTDAHFVPVDMGEFMRPLPTATKTVVKDHHDTSLHNDSGEFPDLLDSGSNLSTMEYGKLNPAVTAVKSSSTVKDESGLTFATLSGVTPDYVDEESEAAKAASSVPVVVARKSAAPEPGTDPSSSQVSPSNFVNALASEAVAQLAKAKISLPAGTCIVPADATGGDATVNIAGQDSRLQVIPQLPGSSSAAATGTPSKPMTITIQYKIFPDSQGQPQKIAVKRELADLISEGQVPGNLSTAASSPATTPLPPAVANLKQDSLASSSTSTTPTPSEGTSLDLPLSTTNLSDLVPSKMPAIEVQTNGPDPAKETRTEITPAGNKYEVPTIVTSGYDLDNMLCTFCNRTFKNDKTLMGHMLNHFGVTPKMAHCPICGLTLQKKSYARHLRLHGNVELESCMYCKKGFRDKKALDKHMKSSHADETPLGCEHCEEKFATESDHDVHMNRHLHEYPWKCDFCELKFQTEEMRNAHHRIHTGDKPFVCEICDKNFTSEKTKRVHVLRHQGGWPHKCDVCSLTFQQRSHLVKHSASHTKKTQVISAKINSFLEDFGASLENDMLGLDNTDFGSAMDANNDNNLEAAAAEAAFMFGQSDLPEELMGDQSAAPAAPIQIVSQSVPVDDYPAVIPELDIPMPKPGDSLACPFCEKVSITRRSFVVHVKRHAGLLNYKCIQCSKTFTSQAKLDRHTTSEHPQETVVAPVVQSYPLYTSVPVTMAPTVIEAASSQPFTIELPENTVAVDIPVSEAGGSSEQAVSVETTKCALCPKTFTDNESLQAHTQIHFQGNASEKRIDSKLLRQKLLNKKRPARCRYLRKLRRLAPTLWHGFTYKCKVCDVSLASRHSKMVHKIVKHGRNSWKCQFCSVLLKSKSVLREHLLTAHKTDRDEIRMLGMLKNANIFAVTKKPYKALTPPPTPSPPPPRLTQETLQATPVTIASGVVLGHDPAIASTSYQYSVITTPAARKSTATVLEYIVDESIFDYESLSCKACKKSFKSTRALKLHRDRHQRKLNHKCPDCVMTFNGRSEVNRHMVAVHGRPLGPEEQTQQNIKGKHAVGVVAAEPVDGATYFGIPAESTGAPFVDDGLPKVIANIALPAELSQVGMMQQPAQDYVSVSNAVQQQPIVVQSENSSTSVSRCSTSLSDRGSLSLSEQGFDLASLKEGREGEESTADISEQKERLIAMMAQRITSRTKSKEDEKAKSRRSKRDKHKKRDKSRKNSLDGSEDTETRPEEQTQALQGSLETALAIESIDENSGMELPDVFDLAKPQQTQIPQLELPTAAATTLLANDSFLSMPDLSDKSNAEEKAAEETADPSSSASKFDEMMSRKVSKPVGKKSEAETLQSAETPDAVDLPSEELPVSASEMQPEAKMPAIESSKTETSTSLEADKEEVQKAEEQDTKAQEASPVSKSPEEPVPMETKRTTRPKRGDKKSEEETPKSAAQASTLNEVEAKDTIDMPVRQSKRNRHASKKVLENEEAKAEETLKAQEAKAAETLKAQEISEPVKLETTPTKSPRRTKAETSSPIGKSEMIPKESPEAPEGRRSKRIKKTSENAEAPAIETKATEDGPPQPVAEDKVPEKSMRTRRKSEKQALEMKPPAEEVKPKRGRPKSVEKTVDKDSAKTPEVSKKEPELDEVPEVEEAMKEAAVSVGVKPRRGRPRATDKKKEVNVAVKADEQEASSEKEDAKKEAQETCATDEILPRRGRTRTGEKKQEAIVDVKSPEPGTSTEGEQAKKESPEEVKPRRGRPKALEKKQEEVVDVKSSGPGTSSEGEETKKESPEMSAPEEVKPRRGRPKTLEKNKEAVVDITSPEPGTSTEGEETKKESPEMSAPEEVKPRRGRPKAVEKKQEAVVDITSPEPSTSTEGEETKKESPETSAPEEVKPRRGRPRASEKNQEAVVDVKSPVLETSTEGEETKKELPEMSAPEEVKPRRGRPKASEKNKEAVVDITSPEPGTSTEGEETKKESPETSAPEEVKPRRGRPKASDKKQEANDSPKEHETASSTEDTKNEVDEVKTVAEVKSRRGRPKATDKRQEGKESESGTTASEDDKAKKEEIEVTDVRPRRGRPKAANKPAVEAVAEKETSVTIQDSKPEPGETNKDTKKEAKDLNELSEDVKTRRGRPKATDNLAEKAPEEKTEETSTPPVPEKVEEMESRVLPEIQPRRRERKGKPRKLTIDQDSQVQSLSQKVGDVKELKSETASTEKDPAPVSTHPTTSAERQDDPHKEIHAREAVVRLQIMKAEEIEKATSPTAIRTEDPVKIGLREKKARGTETVPNSAATTNEPVKQEEVVRPRRGRTTDTDTVKSEEEAKPATEKEKAVHEQSRRRTRKPSEVTSEEVKVTAVGPGRRTRKQSASELGIADAGKLGESLSSVSETNEETSSVREEKPNETTGKLITPRLVSTDMAKESKEHQPQNKKTQEAAAEITAKEAKESEISASEDPKQHGKATLKNVSVESGESAKYKADAGTLEDKKVEQPAEVKPEAAQPEPPKKRGRPKKSDSVPLPAPTNEELQEDQRVRKTRSTLPKEPENEKDTAGTSVAEEGTNDKDNESTSKDISSKVDVNTPPKKRGRPPKPPSEVTASPPPKLEAKPEPEKPVEEAKTPEKSPTALPTETNELLKKRGVTVSKDGTLMIPSQKLTLPPELCRFVPAQGKSKKKFVCKVCSKEFLRKDKINYHIYTEHPDDFKRLGGEGLPRILQKAPSPMKKGFKRKQLMKKKLMLRRNMLKARQAKETPAKEEKASKEKSEDEEKPEQNEVPSEEKEEPSRVTRQRPGSELVSLEDMKTPPAPEDNLQHYPELKKFEKQFYGIFWPTKELLAIKQANRRSKFRDQPRLLKRLLRRVKEPKIYSAQNPGNPLFFTFSRLYKKPAYSAKLVKTAGKPKALKMKLKIRNKTSTVSHTDIPAEEETKEEVQLEEKSPTAKRIKLDQAVSEKNPAPEALPDNANDQTETGLRRRGRPKKGSVLVQDQSKPQQKEPLPSLPSTKPTDDTNKAAVAEVQEQSDSVSRRRGRPKKAEVEKALPVEPSPPSPPPPAAEKPKVDPVAEVAGKAEVNEQPETPARRRGRPKKGDVVQNPERSQASAPVAPLPTPPAELPTETAGGKAIESGKMEIVAGTEQSDTTSLAKDEVAVPKKRGRPKRSEAAAAEHPDREKSSEHDLHNLSSKRPVRSSTRNVKEEEPVEKPAEEPVTPVQEEEKEKNDEELVRRETLKRPLPADSEPSSVRPKRGRPPKKQKEETTLEISQRKDEERNKEQEKNAGSSDQLRVNVIQDHQQTSRIETDIKTCEGETDETPRTKTTEESETQSPPRVSEEKENAVKPIKLVINIGDREKMSPVTAAVSPPLGQTSDPDYVVQSSEANPLKLKLKTGKKKKKKKKDKGKDEKEELKVKLILGESSHRHHHKHKKHKKDKEHAMEVDGQGPSIKILIKSPRAEQINKDVVASVSSSVLPSDASAVGETPHESLRSTKSPGGDETARADERSLGGVDKTRLIRPQENSISIADNRETATPPPSSSSQVLKSSDSSSVIFPSSSSCHRASSLPAAAAASVSASAPAAFPGSATAAPPTDALGDDNQGTRSIKDAEKDSNSTIAAPAAVESAPAVTFSPDASPEHDFTVGLGGFGDDGLGLSQGIYQDVMKAIEDDDTQGARVPTEKKSAFERSQVDGSADTCSRSSVVSVPPSPSTSGEEKERESRKGATASAKRGNVIQERMKQTTTAGNLKPKSKLSLIRRVFSTYSKSRKFVNVKYRKPKQRIYSREEYFERRDNGTLDEEYDEDVDDPTMVKTPAKKGKGETQESPRAVVRPKAIFHRSSGQSSSSSSSSSEEEDDEQAQQQRKKRKLHCKECDRDFPNLARRHAHMLMHQDAKKKGVSVSKEATPTSSPRVSLDDDDTIAQLDGESDLLLPSTSANNMAKPAVSVPYQTVSSLNGHSVIVTTTNSALAASSNGSQNNGQMNYLLQNTQQQQQNPTHIVIVKPSPGVMEQIGANGQQTMKMETAPTLQLAMSDNSLLGYPTSSSVLTFPSTSPVSSLVKSEPSPHPPCYSLNNSTTGSQHSSSSTSSSPHGLSTYAKEILSDFHPMLIKDPVMNPQERDTEDAMLVLGGNQSIHLLDDQTSSIDTHSDSNLQMSFEDISTIGLVSHAPISTAHTTDGSHASFDTSIETSSFLSGSNDLDLASETTNGTATLSIPDMRSESGTPSLQGEFPCTVCDRQFGNKRNLNSHMRRHRGEYKIFCKECKKGFFTQSKLDSHKRKHTGEKPYRCLESTCLKRFRYKGDLSKHIKRYHPNHIQEIKFMPLQEDERAQLALALDRNRTSGLSLAQTASGGIQALDVVSLLPQQPVNQSELTGTPFLAQQQQQQQSSQSDDNDPSLDENIVNMLAQDEPPTAPPVVVSTPMVAAVPQTAQLSAPTSILHDRLTRVTASQVTKTYTVTRPAVAVSAPSSATATSFLVPSGIFKTSSGRQFSLPSQPLQPHQVKKSQVTLTTTATLASANGAAINPPQATATSMPQVQTQQQLIISRALSNVKQPLPQQELVTNQQQQPHIQLVSTASANGMPTILQLPTEPAIVTPPTALLPTRPVKPFPCDYPNCGRSFEKAGLLKRHKKIHEEECPFKCRFCSKTFESKSKIKDHERKHTGEKPFKCEQCGNFFRYKGDRTKHMKNIHKLLADGTPIGQEGSSSSAPVASVIDDNSKSTTTTTILSMNDETNSSISSFQSATETFASTPLSVSEPVLVNQYFAPLETSTSSNGNSTVVTVPLHSPSTPILQSSDGVLSPFGASGVTSGASSAPSPEETISVCISADEINMHNLTAKTVPEMF